MRKLYHCRNHHRQWRVLGHHKVRTDAAESITYRTQPRSIDVAYILHLLLPTTAWLICRDVKLRHPNFVFIAEVYWDMGWDLQQLGFDFTYDKVSIRSRAVGGCTGEITYSRGCWCGRGVPRVVGFGSTFLTPQLRMIQWCKCLNCARMAVQGQNGAKKYRLFCDVYLCLHNSLMDHGAHIHLQRLYDRLEHGDAEGVAGHLSGDPGYLTKCVHFLV